MAKDKKTKKEPGHKLSDLSKLATEMNTIMGLDPAIDPDIDDAKDLTEEIEELGLPYVCPQEEGEYSRKSWEIILALGFDPENPSEDCDDVGGEPEPEPEPKSGKKAPAKKKEPEPDDDEDDDEDEDEDGADEDRPEKSLAETVASAKKLADLKDLVNEHDEFKKLRKKLDDYKKLEGFRDLKAALLDITGPAPKPEPKPSTGSRPKVDKATAAERKAFMVEKIKAGIGKKDLIEAVLKKFPETSRGAVVTQITDGKNPKYCKFDRLVVEDDKGVLTFGKKVG